MAEQTSFTLPGVTVSAPSLAVNREVAAATGTEVITALVLSQQITVSDSTDNPSTSGFSTFTWTWHPPAGVVTDDVTAALADAGWSASLPCLDPALAYTISVTRA